MRPSQFSSPSRIQSRAGRALRLADPCCARSCVERRVEDVSRHPLPASTSLSSRQVMVGLPMESGGIAPELTAIRPGPHVQMMWRRAEQGRARGSRLPLRTQTMVRIPTHRAPTHPGEMLLEEFLNPMGLTQRELALAEAIGVPYQWVNEIVNGRRGITPSTALRLAQYFGMSTEFWMNGQMRWDLYHAKKAEEAELERMTPYRSGRPGRRKARRSQRSNSQSHPSFSRTSR